MRKFRKNILAVTGLLIVGINLIVALLGYLIMPDSSPDANTMMLQIANKKPLFSVQVLKIPKEHSEEDESFFPFLLHGEKKSYDVLPIKKYHVDETNNLLIVSEYTDPEDTSNIMRSFALSLWKGNNFKANIVQHTFWLGTDRFGRDMLSRLILGSRISLSVGILSVLISLLIGISLGAIAGYAGGRIDIFISWFINVMWSIPTLLIVIALSLALGRGFWQVFIAIGLTMWVDVARVVRGQVLGMKQKEFVEAAHAMGFSHPRILFKHILPNISAPIIVMMCSNFASAILLEAGLSFLGYGAQPPAPSWGMMIKEHYGYIILDLPYLAMVPAIAIMLLVIAVNLVGNGLRDAWDVRE